jgi:hypothetical protein
VPPLPRQSYSFNFAALASGSLVFDNHARLSAAQNASATFAGTYGELQTAQKANHAGDLSFISAIPRELPLFDPSVTDTALEIPPVSRLPFQPVLKDKMIGADLPFWDNVPDDIELGGGSGYTTSQIRINILQVQGTGRVRLFLNGTISGTEPVFQLSPKGLVNADIPYGPPRPHSSIEIWYAGNGTIKLDEDSTFNGIIYAPNAKIEIGPGNANFFGAMIAKDIVVLGDSHIYWDPALANWKEDLELH